MNATRSILGSALLAASLAACGSAVEPPASPSRSVAPPTVAPTARPTLVPTPRPTVAAPLVGQDVATKVAIAEGTLGMTVKEFIARYNAHLDQGQYPITAKPDVIGEGQVFQVSPNDAKSTTILFVTNTDESLRSVTALSIAGQKTDAVDRGMAQLEALVIWSTVAVAASPDMSEDEANNILSTVGLTGHETFGSLALVGERQGIRYYVIETADGTDLITHEAN